MRIAVVQTLYPQGHRSLDKGFVKVLSKEHDLLIVDDGKYFPDNITDNPNISRVTVPHFHIKRCESLKRILRRVDLFLIFFVLRIRHEEFDIILFLNIDNDIYKIEKWLPNKRRIIIHHNDIDVLTTSTEKIHQYFNRAKKKFIHICLADYISDAFRSYAHLNDNYVYTVHQPLVFKSKTKEVIKEEVVVGIGNSMDENFIKELIELDMMEELPCKLILRSKNISYSGRNMEVFMGFLVRDKYEELYNKSKVSLVTYPLNYKFRYSGIIDDSLSKGLTVFSNDTLCGRYFATMYPESVFLINDARHLWTMLKNGLPPHSEMAQARFTSRHSDEYVLQQFNKAIQS